MQGPERTLATGTHSGHQDPEKVWGCTVGMGLREVMGHRVLTAMTGGTSSLSLAHLSLREVFPTVSYYRLGN